MEYALFPKDIAQVNHRGNHLRNSGGNGCAGNSKKLYWEF